MGWLARTLGYEKPEPELRIDHEREERIRRTDSELAQAIARNQRANRNAYNDLARGVLAEVQKGRR